MAGIKQWPDVLSDVDQVLRPDYETWLTDVRAILVSMNTEMDLWQDNWIYDFREAYEAGTPAHDAAISAREFWWHKLLAESWT